MKTIASLRIAAAIGAIAIATSAFADVGHDDSDGAAADDHEPVQTQLLMPIMNSRRGMDLFADKGCFTCHAVNGVGGEDASPLDAHNMEPYMNPFDLAAKMWSMAGIMIPIQEEEMGGQIEFTGSELADIIAFLHDDEQQHQFTVDILTPEQREAMDKHGEGEDPH